MSRAKKIGIIAIAACCIIGIGIAVWLFVFNADSPSTSQPASENSANTNEQTTINVSNSNTNTSNVNVSNTETTPANPVTTDTTTELGTNEILSSPLDINQERDLAERICVDMLTQSTEDNAGLYFSNSVPRKFSTSTNSILMYNSGAPINPASYAYKDCKVMMHSIVKISGVHTRHIMNVSAVEKRTSAECALRVNLVLNSSTGKMEYYDQSIVIFRSLPMVESEYSDVLALYDGQQFEGARKVQAQLLLIYSYSPFIDATYWNAISRVVEFGNSENLSHITESSASGNAMADRDIVTEIERGWLPSLDGCGARVTSIEVPDVLSRGNGYTYYKTTVTYRADHNDGAVKDMVTRAVLTVSVNDSTGKIESLVESDSGSWSVSGGSRDVGGARTMKMFLGV